MLTNSPTVAARKVPPLLGCGWVVGCAWAAGAGVLTAPAPVLAGAAAPAAAGLLVGAVLGAVGPHAASSCRPTATPAMRARNVRRLTAVGADRGRLLASMPSPLRRCPVEAAGTGRARLRGAAS